MRLGHQEFKNRRGETLDTYYHPSNDMSRLLILGHGVTGNKDRPLLIDTANGLARLGWASLRVSFAGNGESEGKFEEATITKESEDLQDIIAALPEDLKVAYCGHSMGGAVGVKTALVEDRIKVLISLAGMVQTKEFLEREFGDAEPDKGFMWGEESCPLSSIFADDMTEIHDLVDEASQVKQPFLLIHGTADDVVMPSDSEQSYEAASEPKKIVRVEGAGHSFEETGVDEIVNSIDAWLREHF